jgi:hypothetical protein
MGPAQQFHADKAPVPIATFRTNDGDLHLSQLSEPSDIAECRGDRANSAIRQPHPIGRYAIGTRQIGLRGVILKDQQSAIEAGVDERFQRIIFVVANVKA